MKHNAKATQKAVGSLQGDISAMADDLASLGLALGESASAEASAMLKSLRSRLDNLTEDASGLAREEIQQVRGTIAENPLIALGAAIGLGFVLASLLRR